MTVDAMRAYFLPVRFYSRYYPYLGFRGAMVQIALERTRQVRVCVWGGGAAVGGVGREAGAGLAGFGWVGRVVGRAPGPWCRCSQQHQRLLPSPTTLSAPPDAPHRRQLGRAGVGGDRAARRRRHEPRPAGAGVPPPLHALLSGCCPPALPDSCPALPCLTPAAPAPPACLPIARRCSCTSAPRRCSWASSAWPTSRSSAHRRWVRWSVRGVGVTWFSVLCCAAQRTAQRKCCRRLTPKLLTARFARCCAAVLRRCAGSAQPDAVLPRALLADLLRAVLELGGADHRLRVRLLLLHTGARWAGGAVGGRARGTGLMVLLLAVLVVRLP